MKKARLALLVFIVLLLLAVGGYWWAQPKVSTRHIERPSLPTDQAIVLRLAHIVNPRFARMSEAQIQQILQHAQVIVREHFLLDVEFEWVGERDLQQLMAQIPPEVIDYKRDFIVDPMAVSSSMRKNLVDSLVEVIEGYDSSLQDMMRFAEPYLQDPAEANLQSFADSLTDTLMNRQSYWRKVKAYDGLPVIDDSSSHEWVMWDSLGYGALDFDVAITNQLVASVESYGMDIHSSLRGGITLGTMSNSQQGRYNGFAWMSVFPLINDHPQILILRDDKRYSEEEQLRYAAAVLSHEIGHLLLHLSHPWGEPACIMAPPPVLDYAGWYQGLDAQRCALASLPANTPGAIQIGYDHIE